MNVLYCIVGEILDKGGSGRRLFQQRDLFILVLSANLPCTAQDKVLKNWGQMSGPTRSINTGSQSSFNWQNRFRFLARIRRAFEVLYLSQQNCCSNLPVD